MLLDAGVILGVLSQERSDEDRIRDAMAEATDHPAASSPADHGLPDRTAGHGGAALARLARDRTNLTSPRGSPSADYEVPDYHQADLSTGSVDDWDWQRRIPVYLIDGTVKVFAFENGSD